MSIAYDVVIPASGKGERSGLPYNKVFYVLNDGINILRHSLSLFLADEDCKRVIVVTQPENFEKIGSDPKILCCEGGKERMDSVWQGLHLVQEETVLIHDAARPYLNRRELEDLKDALEECDAAILAVPGRDTLKRVKNGRITETLDREEVWLAQTPQGFRTKLLKEAYEKRDPQKIYTDEASLLEGKAEVWVVKGDPGNHKVTFPSDLR